MDLYYKRLDLSFLLCLLFLLTVPAVFPTARLFFFAPFLIIMYYQKPLAACLWGSLLCGILIDLFSSYERLGICAGTYTFTTLILYRYRERFFSDSLSTLPLMSFFFALIASLVQTGVMFIFDRPISVNSAWFFHDLLLMPFADSAYAFGVFILPFVLFGKPRKKGKDYFLTGT